MKISHIGAAVLALAAATSVSAAPIASNLTSGFSFQNYTGATEVGSGLIGTSSVLFYIDEKEVGGIKSWLIFFDPLTRQNVQATLTFDAGLVVVGVSQTGLTNSTATYGIDVDGDTVLNDYNFTDNSGLESVGDFGDSVNWTPGNNTLTLDFRASDPGDYIRVLTRANDVPEPASWGLAGVALAALVGTQLRRRRKG